MPLTNQADIHLLRTVRDQEILEGTLCYLAEFAGYILEHHLDEFVDLSVKSLRDLDIPLLKHMTKTEGDGVAANSTVEMLTHLVSKDSGKHIQNAIDRWTTNQLPKVERNQIVVADITLIAYSRKLMFLKYLPGYTSDPDTIIHIVSDIEEYILQYTTATFQTFVSIVDDRIQEQIKQLEESQLLFKQAQGLTHIGNYVWNITNNVLLWSDELYRIYELDPKEDRINNTIVGTYNHPDDVDQVHAAMEEARTKIQSFDFFYRIITKSGKVKTLHARGEMEVDVHGKLAKIFGTCQDVSDQKETERQMLQHQMFIQKIADAIPAIIASYNIMTGKYSFLSGGLKKLLGYEASRGLEEGAGFFMELIHPEDFQPLMQKNSEALTRANQIKENEEEDIIEFQYRMRHQSGEYRWFHTYGTVFNRNSRNQVEQVINISLDITESIKAEQILLQKTNELQQSNASLEEFAFVTSHDLKEPLRKISTFIDLLLSMRTNRDAKEDRYLQKILSSTDRMRQMIDNLLSLSLVTSSKSPEYYDLNLLLTEVLSTFEYQGESLKAWIKADPLPSARIVTSQFRQLFQNLIGNALKFARKGVPPEIKITYRILSEAQLGPHSMKKADQYLELVFSDNGIGFEETFSEKIFAIFQRLHQKEVYEGTGIGLAICRRIVNNHGGNIKANGIPNQGATFTLVIPQ